MDIIQPRILAKGKFKPEDIVVTVYESNRKVDLTTEGQLDYLWEEKERKAKEVDIQSLKILSRADFIQTLKNLNANKQFLATQIDI